MSHGTPRRASAIAVLFVALPAALAALEDSSLRVVRLPGNPIIRPEMLNGDLGSNINGLYRSVDGASAFEAGSSPFEGGESRVALSDSAGPRHVAIEDTGATVWVYYSNIGDEPERILRGRLETQGDWRNWRISLKEEVARPETAYEGADLPITRSHLGNALGREHGLRDPFVFQDAGRTYLLYSVAAESGIAITELQESRK